MEEILESPASEILTGYQKQAIDAAAELLSFCNYERLCELAKAEQDGRLVVLPAKTIFELTWDAGKSCDLLCPVSIDGKGCCELCDNAAQLIYERSCRQEHLSQIGKTVFLTREEAEAALEEQKG